MNYELSDDQEFFRETTSRFLDAESSMPAVRDLYDDSEGFSEAYWSQAVELGWTSLLASERVGGGSLSGSPMVDAVIIAEEIGRRCAPGPFFAISPVIAGLTLVGGHDELVGALVSGERVASWAFAEAGSNWDAESFSTHIDADGSELVVSGTKQYVDSGASAGSFLVTGQSSAGPTQVVVPLDVAGLSVTATRSVDMTRRFATVDFDSVRVPRDHLVGEMGNAGPAVAYQRNVAVGLQCAELVGVADRTLEFTLEYGHDRFAFGRPIVSFQALKHRIADMAYWIEASKAASDELALAIDTGGEADLLASVAKAYVGDKCPDVVDDCVQITGGIGVTWEHDIHIYSRRAILDRALHGTPEEHKERIVSIREA